MSKTKFLPGSGTMKGNEMSENLTMQDTAELLVKFAPEITATRRAIKKGQTAAFSGFMSQAVLVFQLHVGHKVPASKIYTALVNGAEAKGVSEKTVRNQWPHARSLALHWQTHADNRPDFRMANSFDAAIELAETWAKAQGMKSFEDVRQWLLSGKEKPAGKPLGETVAKRITSAHQKHELTGSDVLAIFAAIVTVSDPEMLSALETRIADAVSAHMKTELDAADEAARQAA